MEVLIKTLAETIYWVAEQRQKQAETRAKNMTAQIHGVVREIGLVIKDYMIRENNKLRRESDG